MFSELRARAWQIGAFGAGGAALLLAVALGLTTLQKNAAVARANKLDAEINAPLTGYVARLGICEGNAQRLDGALSRQNLAIETLRKDSEDRLAESARNLAAAQDAATKYRVRAQDLAAAQPVGVTQCDRMLDVDRMIQESFR